MKHPELSAAAISLLKKLIATPSFSKEENLTADLIEHYFFEKKIPTHRKKNNVWAFNKNYNPQLPTILLNSHHDTVKPNSGYTKNPFEPLTEENKLFGLGSNDAGGALVALLQVFIHFYEQKNLSYNLVFAATAEEEISGVNGIELIFPDLGKIDFAIVGEPTQMNLAIAEKGLMVLDCVASGKSGHAAREEGINAIYIAMKDIAWFSSYKFEKVSDFLGDIKMTVSIINSGTQHNVVPDKCNFTVDVRLTDAYSAEEVLTQIKQHIQSEVTPRSMRLKPSAISVEHAIVKAGLALNRKIYGSPTSSDQALIHVPSLKIGPGNSARSHTANEFIFMDELSEGIDIYIELLEKIIFKKQNTNNKK